MQSLIQVLCIQSNMSKIDLQIKDNILGYPELSQIHSLIFASRATIFGKLIFSLAPVTKIPEGVVIGFRKFAWAPSEKK